MQKIYKRKITTIFYHLFIALVAVVFIFIIARAIIHTIWVAGIIAFAVMFLAAWFIVSDAKLKIIVDDKNVTFIEGRKITCYEIARCSFYSRITDGTDCNLTVDDGKERYCYDCSYIGLNQYNCLLDDLGITGEKQKIEKLETRKGE